MRLRLSWSRVFWLVALLIPCWIIAFRFHVDLRVIHPASQWIAHDVLGIYGDIGAPGRYFYGPFSLLLIYPLSFLSYSAAQWAWVFLQTLSYWALWQGLHRIFPFLVKGNFWLWFLVWLFALNPIHNNFQSGNIQLMLIALLLWSEIDSKSEKPLSQFRGGILLAFAAAIKVFPLFLFPYAVLTKTKSYLLGVASGCALAFGLPFLAFGFAAGKSLHLSFLSNLTTYGGDNPLTKIPDILCLPSLLARVLPTLGLSVPAAGYLSQGILILVAVACFIFIRREKQRDSRALWALALLTMALLNPSTRVHYFIFYLPAFVWLTERSQGNRRALGLVLGVFTSIALTMEGVVGKKANDFLEYQNVPTWGAILLGLSLAYFCRLGKTWK